MTKDCLTHDIVPGGMKFGIHYHLYKRILKNDRMVKLNACSVSEKYIDENNCLYSFYPKSSNIKTSYNDCLKLFCWNHVHWVFIFCMKKEKKRFSPGKIICSGNDVFENAETLIP